LQKRDMLIKLPKGRKRVNYTISDDEDEPASLQPVRTNAAKRQRVVKDESDDDFGLDDATTSALMDNGG